MLNLLRIAAQIFPKPSSIPDNVQANSSLLATVLKWVFALAGAIALLMITIGGFQYVISQGDAQKISKAKNTIIYSLVGLVLVITSYAIVRFVVQKLGV